MGNRCADVPTLQHPTDRIRLDSSYGSIVRINVQNLKRPTSAVFFVSEISPTGYILSPNPLDKRKGLLLRQAFEVVLNNTIQYRRLSGRSALY